MNLIFLLAFFTSLLGSICTVIGKHLLNKGIRYQSIMFLAFPASIVIGLMVGLAHKDIVKEDLKKMMKFDYFLILIKIILGLYLLSTISYYILNAVPSYVHTALGAIQPVVTLVLGILFLKEKINKNQMIGLVLSIIGVYIISGNSNIEPAPILQKLKIETD